MCFQHFYFNFVFVFVFVYLFFTFMLSFIYFNFYCFLLISMNKIFTVPLFILDSGEER